MADYDWFDDRYNPEKELRDEMRPLGYEPRYLWPSGALRGMLVGYDCLRGCGCIVWDTHTHSKNVCPTYVPPDV